MAVRLRVFMVCLRTGYKSLGPGGGSVGSAQVAYQKTALTAELNATDALKTALVAVLCRWLGLGLSHRLEIVADFNEVGIRVAEVNRTHPADGAGAFHRPQFNGIAL
jgi:hypothetical protein